MTGRTIETGKMEKRLSGQHCEDISYEMRFLDEGDLDGLVRLQDVMERDLPDKEVFRLTTSEEFEELLGQKRTAIGILTYDGLIAYNIVHIPERDGDNFGADIGLDHRELEKVAHLKAVVVHPAYRGNMLQKRMAKVHIEVLRGMGFRHVCSTVSPKNKISLQNHFDNGFVIKGLKVKYVDRLRYIMHKNIVHDFVPGPEVVGVSSADIDRQKACIGRGFAGFKMVGRGDDWEIMYAMPSADQHHVN